MNTKPFLSALGILIAVFSAMPSIINAADEQSEDILVKFTKQEAPTVAIADVQAVEIPDPANEIETLLRELRKSGERIEAHSKALEAVTKIEAVETVTRVTELSSEVEMAVQRGDLATARKVEEATAEELKIVIAKLRTLVVETLKTGTEAAERSKEAIQSAKAAASTAKMLAERHELAQTIIAAEETVKALKAEEAANIVLHISRLNAEAAWRAVEILSSAGNKMKEALGEKMGFFEKTTKLRDEYNTQIRALEVLRKLNQEIKIIYKGVTPEEIATEAVIAVEAVAKKSEQQVSPRAEGAVAATESPKYVLYPLYQ